MMVFQVRLPRRRAAAMAAAVVMVAAAAAVLAGCFNGKEKSLTLADDTARVSYLQELGWQVESTPVETLDLQLPQELAETWGEYAAMQTAQGMPFADYAGQPVRRYTYRVTNYPGMEKGVQANLYLCGDVLIGGDIVATGKGGFQHGLEYPGV